MHSAVVPTPTPQPPVEVNVIIPTPSPFPTPFVNLPATNPWEWGLDSLVGILSALLALAAVGLSAWIALDERGRRKHAERKIVGEAAFAYIDAVERPGDDTKAYARLTTAFAAADVDEEPLHRWLVESGRTRRDAQKYAEHELQGVPDSSEPPPPSWFAYRSVDAEVREKLLHWIRTGSIDSSPVRNIAERLAEIEQTRS